MDRAWQRLLVAGVVLAATGLPAAAQGVPPGLGLEHGALLFHGNYCGPGNRWPSPPVDALDRACMQHDVCSPAAGSGRLPRCYCNAHLRDAAALIAANPHQPDDLRALAGLVSSGAALLPCD